MLARFFTALGYSAGEWRTLEADLRIQHLSQDAEPGVPTPHGQPFVIRAILTLGNLGCGRASTYSLGFNGRHSIPDSSATEQEWLVTAANRASDIHQLVATQSATNYQWSPLLVDDVFIAEGEFTTQRRSRRQPRRLRYASRWWIRHRMLCGAGRGHRWRQCHSWEKGGASRDAVVGASGFLSTA